MKSIKLKNDYYLDSNGIMHNKNLISEIVDSILDYIDNWIILKKYTKSVTIGANSFTNVNVGSIVKIDGYTAVGVLTTENGYGDQWLVNYSMYSGSQIQAMIHSKYGYSLTASLVCHVIYIKTDIYNKYLN